MSLAPINKSETYNFAFCANDRYLHGLLMTMISTLRSMPDSARIRVHVLDAGLSKVSIGVLTDHISKYPNARLEFLRCDENVFREIAIGKRHISMFFRLSLPEILDCEEVIYIDSDFLVFGDPTRCFETFASSREPIAAVQDWETPCLAADSLEMARLCKLEHTSSYFNSGFLALNLATLRKEKFTKRAIEVLGEVGHMSRFHDQTAFNILYPNRWEKLAPGWNTPAWSFDQQEDNQLPGGIHFTNSAPWLQQHYRPSQALFERMAADFGVTLPKPEISLRRTCAIAVLKWFIAPARSIFQLMRSFLAMICQRKNKALASTKIARFWGRYFWNGPLRVYRYHRRICEIRDSQFHPNDRPNL